MTEMLNPFRIAQKQLDHAAEKLGLDDATHEFLRWPMRELKVSAKKARILNRIHSLLIFAKLI